MYDQSEPEHQTQLTDNAAFTEKKSRLLIMNMWTNSEAQDLSSILLQMARGNKENHIPKELTTHDYSLS